MGWGVIFNKWQKIDNDIDDNRNKNYEANTNSDINYGKNSCDDSDTNHC